MVKFLKRVLEKFIDASIEKIIGGLLGITGLAIWPLLRPPVDFLKQRLFVSLGEILAGIVVFLFMFLLGACLRKKLVAKRLFKEGAKVTLSTKTHPIMSVGKYNFISNKLSCSWIHDGQVKNQWINQNQLVEYEKPQYKTTHKKQGGFFERRTY